MMRLHTRFAIAAILAAVAPSAMSLADVITLSDGTKITGTMVRQGDSMIITSTDGGVRTVRASEVAGVALVSTISPAERAENDWRQLQPLLNKQDKLDNVIALLEKFESANRGKPAAEKAATAIASYKVILGQSPVKFRGVWIPKDKVEVEMRAQADAAKPILEAYRTNKFKEALQLSEAELKTHPENSEALLPAGMAAYHLNQLPAARGFFERLAAINQDSLIAHNNLGVINFEMNRAGDGLQSFLRALRISPDDARIIENAGAALAQSEKRNKSSIYLALANLHKQSYARMEREMALRGLVRNGAVWSTREQIDNQLEGIRQADAAVSTAQDHVWAAETAISNNYIQISRLQPVASEARRQYEYYRSACHKDTYNLEAFYKSLWQSTERSIDELERYSSRSQSELYWARQELAQAMENRERLLPNTNRTMRMIDPTDFSAVRSEVTSAQSSVQ